MLVISKSISKNLSGGDGILCLIVDDEGANKGSNQNTYKMKQAHVVLAEKKMKREGQGFF